MELSVLEAYQEEKRNRRGSGFGVAFEAEQNGDHHHGEADSDQANQQSLPSAHSVKCKRWEQRGQHEDNLDTAIS